MTEPTAGAETTGRSAGALLRAARERQGLHIAALAATIKIPQRKLEALESDRHDELPDATFTRALAMTVCRALKIDAAPVLAQLPQIGGKPLPDVAGGLNAPYRERSGRDEPALGPLHHPLAWVALLVLAAAALVFLLPSSWWRQLLPGSADSAAAVGFAAPAELPAASAVSAVVSALVPDNVNAAPAAASAAAVEVVHSVSADPEAGASAAAEAAAGVAVLRANEASWVEAIDASGQVLVQRVLQPGESLGLDGRLPFKLKIGNAAATQLQFRGQSVDLGPVTRDNIARLELK